MNNAEKLLRDMRCEVDYTDVATMSMPLYKRIKATLNGFIGHIGEPNKMVDRPPARNSDNVVKCFICDDEVATVMTYCPEGCTCSDNKYQPRCFHHYKRLLDSCDNFYVLEVYKGSPFADQVHAIGISELIDQQSKGVEWVRLGESNIYMPPNDVTMEYMDKHGRIMNLTHRCNFVAALDIHCKEFENERGYLVKNTEIFYETADGTRIAPEEITHMKILKKYQPKAPAVSEEVDIDVAIQSAVSCVSDEAIFTRDQTDALEQAFSCIEMAIRNKSERGVIKVGE